jgi:shikimate dehydrogenase
MHGAALRALRLDALYAPFHVPRRDLAPMLRAFTLAGVEGLNVTVPLKEAVLPLLDRLDPTAEAMGAVNTIVMRQRRLVGYNTDGIGFAHALRELGWRVHAARAVILGAGGAARAVAWELARTPGTRLVIANRHVARAQRLARWLTRRRRRISVRAVPLDAVTLEDTELLVNATTVGMRASDGLPVSLRTLRSGTLVYDLISHRETALVRAARRRGALAANGVTMLLYQGAESFRLWWRRQPPLTPMRRALMQQLRRHTG